MDRFVKGKRKAIEVTQTQAGHSKTKCRKYDEAYLALGFTVNVVGEEERPTVRSINIGTSTQF